MTLSQFIPPTTSIHHTNKTYMITLELAQEFLHDKNTHWIEDYQVTSVTIRSDFGYDEWVFFCEYWDCGLLQSAKVTAPISQFNSWLQERREKQILELV